MVNILEFLLHSLQGGVFFSAVALGYHLEFKEKALLMNIPHPWAIQPEEINLVLTWKFHPYWLAFKTLEITIHETEEEK